MRRILIFAALVIHQFLPSHKVLGQTPDSGVASTFALFTGAGAVSNTGALTGITGDVGTNNVAMSGFPVNGVNGAVQINNQATRTAARGVLAA